MSTTLKVLVALVPFPLTPLATAVYNSTLNTWPGTWALCAMGLMITQFPIFITLFCISLNRLKSREIET